MNNLDNNTETAMKIISKSGNAKSQVFEAFEMIKLYKYNQADYLLKSSKTELSAAHKLQFDMLIEDAGKIESSEAMNFFIAHAQDHLMAAILANDIMTNQIEMLKRIQSIEKEIEKTNGI